MRLLVLGADAAGMTAASHVRRELPAAEVVAIERGPYTSYSMCGIPYYVGQEVDRASDLVVRTPEQHREAGITVHLRTEALAIDPGARRVRVRDLQSGAAREEPYDALLYAVGAHPSLPTVAGAEEFGRVVHTLDEGERLRGELDALEGDIKRVVVVGAGYIGMELAEALVRRGFEATLLDRSSQVMRQLDPEMAEHVERILIDFGVGVRLGEELREVRGHDGRCYEVVTDLGIYPAEGVVIAAGSRPNVDMAVEAGCELGTSGALLVDERMRTSVDGIWAAGDCVESVNLVHGGRRNVQLGTHANKQGRVAGIDLVSMLSGHGPGEATFPGHVGTAITKVCEWEIARTGLQEAEVQQAGIDYAAIAFTGTAKAGYLPDAGTVHVKMLAEAGTGRMLGAQFVGNTNVGKRIDVAATWCQLGVTVQQAQFLDLSYAPPFGGVWDLLQVGARKLTRKLGLSPAL
ncbi:MAG: SidA/IucD/PvdA family monooxygenase [Nitriliruptorales bacterium]|nr:SidA/IucD/PvdA family monooxygenase [Nitriliruptorales bacterium]